MFRMLTVALSTTQFIYTWGTLFGARVGGVGGGVRFGALTVAHKAVACCFSSGHNGCPGDRSLTTQVPRLDTDSSGIDSRVGDTGCREREKLSRGKNRSWYRRTPSHVPQELKLTAPAPIKYRRQLFFGKITLTAIPVIRFESRSSNRGFRRILKFILLNNKGKFSRQLKN